MFTSVRSLFNIWILAFSALVRQEETELNLNNCSLTCQEQFTSILAVKFQFGSLPFWGKIINLILLLLVWAHLVLVIVINIHLHFHLHSRPAWKLQYICRWTVSTFHKRTHNWTQMSISQVLQALDTVLIHLCLKGNFTMNQFYESSSLRTCPDGSRGCLIQECARDLHLCVKIEKRRKAKRDSFSVSHSKGSGDHVSLFSISYLLIIKKYSLPLAFWCTFHFWHLLYMQYPVVLCPEKKKKKQPKMKRWLNF